MNSHNNKQSIFVQTKQSKDNKKAAQQDKTQAEKFKNRDTKIEGLNKREKNPIKKRKKHHINLRSQDTKLYDFLLRKNENELLDIIKYSNVKPLQKAAIEELARRAESGHLDLFNSYMIVIKYSENARARNALVENTNKPLILKWVIENSPYEDTREAAKNRLTLVLNRPKV